jgi:hypothetical protein
MIVLTLTTTVWYLGLMAVSLHFKSPMLSLLTGLFIAYEALLYTQTDKSFCLLLTGLGLTMIGYSVIFSSIKVNRTNL